MKNQLNNAMQSNHQTTGCEMWVPSPFTGLGKAEMTLGAAAVLLGLSRAMLRLLQKSLGLKEDLTRAIATCCTLQGTNIS